MRHKSTKLLIGSTTLASLWLAQPAAAQAPNSCPLTSTTTTWVDHVLDEGTDKYGVEYNNGVGLTVSYAGGNFKTTQLGISDTSVYMAVGDWDHDGWTDLVGQPEFSGSTNFLKPYLNATFRNPEPNWNNPNDIRTPRFTTTCREILTNQPRGRPVIAGGDFNGDGWDDIFYVKAVLSGNAGVPSELMVFANNRRTNQATTLTFFDPPYSAVGSGLTMAAIGYQTWSSAPMVLDYNGDRRLDVLIPNGSSGGSIRILLNNCTAGTPSTSSSQHPPDAPTATSPLPCSGNVTFVDGGVLMSSLGMSTNTAGHHPAFTFVDADGDGRRDLVIGAPSLSSTASMRLRMFKGLSTGGLSTTAVALNAKGAATFVLGHDFTLDGAADIFYGTDNWNYGSGTAPVVPESLNTSTESGIGGLSFLFKNNGTTTPYSAAPIRVTTRGGNQSTAIAGYAFDYDLGVMLDYDHDPQGTMDVIVADGNHSQSFYVLANRVEAIYADCGNAVSGIIDLGPLTDTEMVINGGRITPNFVAPAGTTVSFYMTNEEPVNWVLASLCPSSTTDYCAQFPRPVGRKMRWKAVMCSNTTHTVTPRLIGVEAKFDYQPAREHYRSGVVVSDGAAYISAFRQPGQRGHLYATNAALNTTYWDASVRMEAMADSQRKIYTSQEGTNVRLDFTTGNASNVILQQTLMTSSPTQTTDVINWVRGKRFGVGNDGLPTQRLGAIETSTPAVLNRPFRPNWYSFMTTLEQQRTDAFVQNNAQRPRLVFFGAKDGMIHAIRTNPTDMTNATNGSEAWAFIPPKIAQGMLTDYTTSQSTGTLNVSSYPDGSPTLFDYNHNGVIKTAAIVASGNGGTSIMALDVTNTVNYAVQDVMYPGTGPIPLWSATPGEAEAGRTYTKPAAARVKINNSERYAIIAASGPDAYAANKGRIVVAYDLITGQPMWKFQAKCAVTSDITVFETDDDQEPGEPTLDGYIDRIAFADACGFVYKLRADVDMNGEYVNNNTMGAFNVGNSPDGIPQYALFALAPAVAGGPKTSGALGSPRPIAGTLAARTDGSSRMVLFFGTGGLENQAPTLVNEFYAIYADTGEIRSKMTGACVGGRCEKFYGGTVVTPTQVIVTRTIDPLVGTASCDPGSSKVEGLALNPNADVSPSNKVNFRNNFTINVAAAIMGALFGDAGAVYYATLSGDVSRIGQPRAANAGDDSSAGVGVGMGNGDGGNGNGGGNGTGTGTGTGASFALYGWRQVL